MARHPQMITTDHDREAVVALGRIVRLDQSAPPTAGEPRTRAVPAGICCAVWPGALGRVRNFGRLQGLSQSGRGRDPFADGDALSGDGLDGQVRSTSANATRTPPVARAWRSANQAPASAVVTAALAVS